MDSGTPEFDDERTRFYESSVSSICEGWEKLQALEKGPAASSASAIICLIIVARAALAVIPAGCREEIVSRQGLGAATLAKIIYDPRMPSPETASLLLKEFQGPRVLFMPTKQLLFEEIAEDPRMGEVLWYQDPFLTFYWSASYMLRQEKPSAALWRNMARLSLLEVELEADSHDFSVAVNAAVDRVTQAHDHLFEIAALPEVMRIKYRHKQGVDPTKFTLLYQEVADTSEPYVFETSQTFSHAHFECFAAVNIRPEWVRNGAFDTVKLFPVFGLGPIEPSREAPWSIQHPTTFVDGSRYMLYFVVVRKDQGSNEKAQQSCPRQSQLRLCN